MSEKPVISDYRSGTKDHPDATQNIALWLRHKKEGGAPYLDGFVMVGDRKVQVFGNFTALDSNAERYGENHPVIRLRAKNGDESELLEKSGVWPQNSKQNGKPVNYRTLVVKVGSATLYPTVFDGIGEARKYLGFAGEPRSANESAPGESAGAAPRPSAPSPAF